MKPLLLCLLLAGCTYNVDYVKSHAKDYLTTQGYEIVSYEGYQGFGSFCGGDVWYEVKRANSEVIYQLALCRWGKELHMYNIKALNAISNEP
jgi:hypothetical protein